MKACTWLVALAAVACLCVPAAASIQGGPYVDDSVSGFDVDDLLDNTVSTLSSTRSAPTASGVHIDPSTFTSWDDFSILAEITVNGDFLHYSYTLTSEQLARLSHFTLEISPGAFDDILNAKITFSGTDEDEGDFSVMPTPTLDNDDGSIGDLADNFFDIFKFDNSAPEGTDTAVFEFDTLRLPVFGNFFAKDGQGNAMNSGLAQLGGLIENGASVDLDSPTSWIPVPDTSLVPGGGQDPIPEPLSLVVWMGLTGIVMARRTRA